MRLTKALPVIVLGISLSAGIITACTVPAAQTGTGAKVYMEPAFKKFDAHLAECTRKTGYDRDNVAKLGKFEIAPGEDQWRECAYQGVKTIIIPQTRSPGLYTTLIQTHQILTDNVKNKVTTRNQRRARIEALVADIRRKEAEQLGLTEGSPMREKSPGEKSERMRRMILNMHLS